MSLWGKKKFVEVVAETKNKEVTTRVPIVSKPAPSAEPKEVTVASRDDKEKTVNEEKNTANSKKRMSPEKTKSPSNGKGGKRDGAVSEQEQDKNMSHTKEEIAVVPEKKERIIGTVKGAGAWGHSLLVDKIKEKTAEEEAAAAAAVVSKKKPRVRENADIVTESPDVAGEKKEEMKGGDMAEIHVHASNFVEGADEDQQKKVDDVEVATPVAESRSPKHKEGKNQRGRKGANHKEEAPVALTELIPAEDSVIVPVHQDPQPEAEQPPAVVPAPVVTFPDGVCLATNMQYMFEGFLYTPKEDKPVVPRSPPAASVGMTASPAPMAMTPMTTTHAPSTPSREYTSFQQPISGMQTNVGVPAQHQRFTNYAPATHNWNGNVSNHMGNRYTSADYHGHQQGAGFAGAPQSHPQRQFNRNYNMPLPHGQPMGSSHHQQQGNYPNPSQVSYNTNNGYGRGLRRNSGMINIARPNNNGAQVRPQPQGGYAPFYSPRGQYHPNQGYRGTGATFYQPHHHNQYNSMNNNGGGSYINQQPNIGRGGSAGNLPAYTQQ